MAYYFSCNECNITSLFDNGNVTKLDPIKEYHLIKGVSGGAINVLKDKKNDDIYLDKNAWDYSNTTSRYRKLYLNEDTKTTKEKIKKAIYILEDLN